MRSVTAMILPLISDDLHIFRILATISAYSVDRNNITKKNSKYITLIQMYFRHFYVGVEIL